MTPPDHKMYIHPKDKWSLTKRVACVREHFKFANKAAYEAGVKKGEAR